MTTLSLVINYKNCLCSADQLSFEIRLGSHSRYGTPFLRPALSQDLQLFLPNIFVDDQDVSNLENMRLGEETSPFNL